MARKTKFEESFLGSFPNDDRLVGDTLNAVYPFWERDTDPGTVAIQKAAASLVANVLASRFLNDIDSGFCQTESPIERLMLAGLMAGSLARGCDICINPSHYWFSTAFGNEGYVSVTPQFPVGRYRADLLVELTYELPEPDDAKPTKEWPVHKYTSRLIVECDGHDFHEKTKEQAKRDKSRDRELLKCGYPVFHYTGSEIWNDVFRCVNEIIDHLEKMPGVRQ